MRFTKIPNDGASWDSALCYAIETESSNPSDVVVEIVDAISGELMGVRRLYGITEAEIDIAPYVRRAIGVATLSTATLQLSPSARKVVVRVGDVEAPVRLYYRATIDLSRPHIISSMEHQRVVGCGEVIRYTLYAKREVRVTVSDKSLLSPVRFAALDTFGLPVELAIDTSSYKGDSVPITVEITCDNLEVYTMDYAVMEPSAGGCRLAWYNSDGGIECYTFPRVIRSSIESTLMTQIHGAIPRLRTAAVRYRLISAMERSKEIERILGIVLSPDIFECNGKECRSVKLLSRNIAFDDHGGLRRIELEIEKGWRRELWS